MTCENCRCNNSRIPTPKGLGCGILFYGTIIIGLSIGLYNLASYADKVQRKQMITQAHQEAEYNVIPKDLNGDGVPELIVKIKGIEENDKTSRVLYKQQNGEYTPEPYRFEIKSNSLEGKTE